MIGTSDGHAYEDEMDFHLGRKVELDNAYAGDLPVRAPKYDDQPTPAQQWRDGENPEKPSYSRLKEAEFGMENQDLIPKDEDFSIHQNQQKIGDKILQSPYERAQAGMDLNPQERSLYERHLNNLNSKGGVDNANGSRSSLYVGTYGVDDKTYVLPRVRDGKILDADSAFQAAKKEGLDNYPSYKSRDEAEKRYQQMHNFMEEDTRAYLKSRDPFKTKVEGKNQDRVPQNAPFPNPAAPEQVVATKIADVRWPDPPLPEGKDKMPFLKDKFSPGDMVTNAEAYNFMKTDPKYKDWSKEEVTDYILKQNEKYNKERPENIPQM